MDAPAQSVGVKRWARAHPRQAWGQVVWLLLILAWGGAGGAALAWGPLTARGPVIILMGIVGAALHGGLWVRQQMALIRGDLSLAMRWFSALSLAHVTIFLSVAVVAGVQMHRAGLLLPASQDRGEAFDQLVRAIGAGYPYFELKQVDWDRIVEKYRPRVAAADSDEAYYGALERMLAELNDTHTGLLPSTVKHSGCLFAATREIEGQALVVAVHGIARRAGVTTGSTVSGVDGQRLEEALNTLDPRLTVGSSPQQRRSRAFHYLLQTPYGDRRTVTFETPEGERRTELLVCPGDPAAAQEAQQRTEPGDRLFGTDRKIVTRRLSSGVGYIAVPTFETDLVAAFDRALDAQSDAPGLILDLRANEGGKWSYAHQMAGRLLSEPFSYGRITYATQLPSRLWRKRMTFRVKPRAPVYTGPVVILIGEDTLSSAEQFVVSLVDSGRATTVGRTTGGASGHPVNFRLSGSHVVRFSMASFTRNDGTLIEGVGLVPDVPVAWTVEDLRRGCDPDIEMAERLLLPAD